MENLESGELIEKKVRFPTHIFRQVIQCLSMKDREAVYESEIKLANPQDYLVEMKIRGSSRIKRSKDQIRVEIVYSQYHIEEIGEGRLRVTFENLSKNSGVHSKIPDPLGITILPITLLNGIKKINQLKK